MRSFGARVQEGLVGEHPLGARDLLLQASALRLERRRLSGPDPLGPHDDLEDPALLLALERHEHAVAPEACRRILNPRHRRGSRRVSRTGLGPGAEDQAPVVELRPDLLGDVREHRVQQAEQAFEGRERHRDRPFIAGVQTGFDRLGVPVAEVVEGEVVEPLDSVGEVERGEKLLDLRPRLVDPREDPALLERVRAECRREPLGVAEDQSRHVPELARELRALVDLLPAETHVLGRGDLQQAVARRVRAVPRDRLERIDAGAEALRHPPPVRGKHRGGDDHIT